MARKVDYMSTFDSLKLAILIVVVAIVTIAGTNEYHAMREFDALRGEALSGLECEIRESYVACFEVTDIYVGPPR